MKRQGIALHAGGLTTHEVLRMATLNGARAIGLAQDLGSIEPAKRADLLVLDEDPLQDIRNTLSIEYVMKNGELFAGDTLDQTWPQQKKLEPLDFWDTDPAPVKTPTSDAAEKHVVAQGKMNRVLFRSRKGTRSNLGSR